MGVSPAKRLHFKVIEDGLTALDPSTIAFIQIPNVTIETAEHTEGNFVVQTPVRIIVEEFEIGLYEDRDIRNNWWLTKLPFNPLTGAFRAHVDRVFSLTVQQLKDDIITPIRQWVISECLAKGSSYERSERTSTDNQIRTIICKPKQVIETPL
jgi:hypothetical protein